MEGRDAGRNLLKGAVMVQPGHAAFATGVRTLHHLGVVGDRSDGQLLAEIGKGTDDLKMLEVRSSCAGSPRRSAGWTTRLIILRGTERAGRASYLGRLHGRQEIGPGRSARGRLSRAMIVRWPTLCPVPGCRRQNGGGCGWGQGDPQGSDTSRHQSSPDERPHPVVCGRSPGRPFAPATWTAP